MSRHLGNGRADPNTSTSSASKVGTNSIQPSGWWRYSGAAAVTASVTTAAYFTTSVGLPLAARLILLPKTWRVALQDVLMPPHAFVSIVLLQLVVFVYWRCLMVRDLKETKKGSFFSQVPEVGLEISALFVVLLFVQKLGIGTYASDLDIAGITLAQWYLWIVLRSQLGQSSPLFPAIEGRTRFFRVKSRLGVALTDTLRTVVLSTLVVTIAKILLSISSLLGMPSLVSFGVKSLSIKPLIRPTTLFLSWLIHSAFHATEVVATERFRFCRMVIDSEASAQSSKSAKAVGSGQRLVAVLGMDNLIASMGQTSSNRRKGKAIDKELAFLDACLLAEKSCYWRSALFTYNKGGYWYLLTQLIYQELTSLEQKLVDASKEGVMMKRKAQRKPQTRSMSTRDIQQQQRAFLTAKNIQPIAESVRDNQVIFTWSVRTITALAKACTKEDPLGVSQRHSKKPSLQDILVSMVSLYLLFTSIEVQLAQASGKQSAMVSSVRKIVHRILGVNALDGDMETIYTNIWAMTDTLKLAIYAIVKAFTCDLFALQMENIVDTLAKASENTSAMRDDPFCEKLPLFYPLWLEEGRFGHGTPSQHAYILNQVVLHNL